jgi:4-alpha-glucanotransferase
VPKFHLVLLIHGHQPVGNFDGVFEQVYRKSYLPFVEVLARHPSVRMGLHYTGPLLEWFEARHPEFLDVLRELVVRGQVEMVGGGFYEPILVSIPPQDQAEQIRRMREYLERKFGLAPTGAWLAERVWEPQVPSVLSSAQVEYTLVDDVHFLAAGFEQEQLFGDYVAEDRGKIVRLLPGIKTLRYLLPFAPPEDAIHFLRDCANRHPGGMAAMGDDCEKFGAWPTTYDLCYRENWVDRFFTALEGASDWLMTTTPRDYLAAHAPLGRADLPTASYTEMMGWVLPTPARQEFQRIEKEFAIRPDVLRFVRGGAWRGFFTKYPESNLLHKKMLHVSEELRRSAARRSSQRQVVLDEAWTHVLRSQCNDVYWHGIFGGLYAPHLRSALWSELVCAETLLSEGSSSRDSALQVERSDFDADGVDEVYVTSRRMAALLRPADGGTLAALDFRGAGITLINSIQRRPEAYHSELRNASAAAASHIVSIHEGGRATEAGLERFLVYDRWPRNAFRLYVFPRDKKFEDYRKLQMDEQPTLAGGNYAIHDATPAGVTLICDAPASTAAHVDLNEQLSCAKKFTFARHENGYRVSCEFELVAGSDAHSSLAKIGPSRIGIEMVLNLLAPDASDRYFEVGAARHPLRWSAAVQASELQDGRLRMVDEWQGVAITLQAPAAAEFWIVPIETVSDSEAGFERVYQGSQILIVWTEEFAAGATWRGQVTLDVEPAKSARDASGN